MSGSESPDHVGSEPYRAEGRPTPLGRAVAELGRITKTLYLLAYLDDETYPRRI